MRGQKLKRFLKAELNDIQNVLDKMPGPEEGYRFFII